METAALAPRHSQIAHCRPLQSCVVRCHGAGNTRRKHMGGTDRQAEPVCRADPRPLRRLPATTSLCATLSPSFLFPVLPVIGQTCSRDFSLVCHCTRRTKSQLDKHVLVGAVCHPWGVVMWTAAVIECSAGRCQRETSVECRESWRQKPRSRWADRSSGPGRRRAASSRISGRGRRR
jgi:hypothetical protein